MVQNAVASLCEMASMAQLKCATFLIIYVLYTGIGGGTGGAAWA